MGEGSSAGLSTQRFMAETLWPLAGGKAREMYRLVKTRIQLDGDGVQLKLL